MRVWCHRFITLFTFAALVQQQWARAVSKESRSASEIAPPRVQPASPSAYKVEILRRFPHEGQPFTQGLEISNDGHHLVETSGSYPAGTDSFIRLIDPATGKTIRSLSDGLDSRFAEGIVQAANGHWFMSTYLDKKVVEYDKDLNIIADHDYPSMGWGLTRSTDGESFLATNGSEHVMTLQGGTFKILEAKVVTCMGKKVTGLNELEMVDDFMGQGPTLLGNVYLSRLVLAVNPTTGKCTGVFNLDGLGKAEAGEVAGFHVANGLAYNKSSGTLYATGKNWEEMFEVRIRPDPDGAALTLLSTHIQNHQAPQDVLLQQYGSTHLQSGKKNLMRNLK